jgi:hypothetical protein
MKIVKGYRSILLYEDNKSGYNIPGFYGKIRSLIPLKGNFMNKKLLALLEARSFNVNLSLRS